MLMDHVPERVVSPNMLPRSRLADPPRPPERVAYEDGERSGMYVGMCQGLNNGWAHTIWIYRQMSFWQRLWAAFDPMYLYGAIPDPAIERMERG